MRIQKKNTKTAHQQAKKYICNKRKLESIHNKSPIQRIVITRYECFEHFYCGIILNDTHQYISEIDKITIFGTICSYRKW